MQIGDRTTVTGIILSAAIALGTLAVPQDFWTAHEGLRGPVLVGCGIIAIVCVLYLCYLHIDWRSKVYPVLLMILGAAFFFTGAIWLGVINEQPPVSPSSANIMGIRPQPSERDAPDVIAQFMYPKSPALVLVNRSDKIARQIKWSVAIWNLDDPRIYMNPSPAEVTHDPLPIPVSTFDFLRPHASGGPLTLFNQQYVKSGQRLFGSVSVICPECSRGHTYVISVIWGSGGWYTEILDRKEGELVIPPHFTKDLIVAYYEELLKKIPESSRKAIGNG
jgi:hypothetical protein